MTGHINVAELDAVLKGINLALKWGLQEIEISTNSAMVCGSMKSIDSRVMSSNEGSLRDDSEAAARNPAGVDGYM